MPCSQRATDPHGGGAVYSRCLAFALAATVGGAQTEHNVRDSGCERRLS